MRKNWVGKGGLERRDISESR